MTKIKLVVAVGILCLTTSKIHAAATAPLYNIKLCVISLSKVIDNPLLRLFADRLHHVYLTATGEEGLNFGPETRKHFMCDHARIGIRNYEEASCHSIYETSDHLDFYGRWQAIHDEYHRLARSHNYRIAEMNCHNATEMVIDKLGYTVPVELHHKLGWQSKWQEKLKKLNSCTP